MNDDIIRKHALNPQKSFIVQAPAGSGKTQLLIARILSLLAHRVSKPESILAITFTKKASEEMKHRVMDALRLAKGPMPQEEHEKTVWTLASAALKADEIHGWGILQNPQRLRIMTIDALCSSITRQLPLSSRLGVRPQSVDYARTLYIKAAQDTLTDLLDDGDPFIETLLLHLNNNQETACGCIADMLASRDEWLPLIYAHDTDDLEKLRAQLESNMQRVLDDSLDKALTMAWCVDWDALLLYVPYAAANQRSVYFEQHMSGLPKWRALCQWLCTTEGELRKTVDKRQGFPSASSIKDSTLSKEAKAMKEGFIAWLDHVRDDEEACEAIKEMAMLPDPVYTDRQWEVLKALFHILPEAVTRLQTIFTLRGEADFTAVTRCALTALGGDDEPTDLDLKLDDALQHILVDEFQDTSSTQFELIRRLVTHWENDGEKTLFLVGDPMQSIYRFRQAEVGGFLQAKQYGIGGITLESLHLMSNFRSQKPIIDWINAQMPAVFSKKDDMYLGAITYAPFEAMREGALNAGVFYHQEDALHVLSNLVQDDMIQSIAILVRTRSHVKELMPMLRAANIPYQALEIEHITQTACVRQLFQLTQAYLNLANTSAWLSVLMSPYCGLILSDLTHLKQHRNTYWEALSDWESLEGLSTEGRLILARIAPLLRHAIIRKHDAPLAQSIEQIWYALGGPASLPTKESLLDAAPYLRLLQQCDQGGTLDVVDFEARLSRLFSNASQIAKVQIMTIHRSKGLEFDAVLIPSLEKQPKASKKPLLLSEMCLIGNDHVLLFAPIHATHDETDPLYDFFWKKNRIREKHESARLLYVALTRARKRLHLFGKEGVPKPSSFLKMLNMSDSSEKNIDPVAPDPVITALRRLSPSWENPYFPTSRVSPSFLSKKSNPIDHEMILPERYEDKTLGTLIHKELFLWAEYPPLMTQSMREHIPRWRAMLLESGLSVQHIPWIGDVMQRVRDDPRAQYILGPQIDARSEYELTGVINAKMTTCVIDRTFVDPSGVRVIIDYKTGAYHEAYAEQLSTYAAMMQSFEDKPVRLCLYFPVTGEWREFE